VSERGFSLEDLPGIYREEYLYAVETARAQHDPCLEWEAFTEAVWEYLVSAFGLDTVSASGQGLDTEVGGGAD
jgi:hypothetical protein